MADLNNLYSGDPSLFDGSGSVFCKSPDFSPGKGSGNCSGGGGGGGRPPWWPWDQLPGFNFATKVAITPDGELVKLTK